MPFKHEAQRDQTIDLIKAAAIWNVILSHVAAAPFSGGTVGTGQWLSALFWAGLTHSSVALFLMASGALLGGVLQAGLSDAEGQPHPLGPGGSS